MEKKGREEKVERREVGSSFTVCITFHNPCICTGTGVLRKSCLVEYQYIRSYIDFHYLSG